MTNNTGDTLLYKVDDNGDYEWVIDPETGEGMSPRKICDLLNTRPHPHPTGDRMHKLDVHIVLDALAQAAKGKPLDPEICQHVEDIANECDHKDFTAEDVQALYDCGSLEKRIKQLADESMKFRIEVINLKDLLKRAHQYLGYTTAGKKIMDEITALTHPAPVTDKVRGE